MATLLCNLLFFHEHIQECVFAPLCINFNFKLNLRLRLGRGDVNFMFGMIMPGSTNYLIYTFIARCACSGIAYHGGQISQCSVLLLLLLWHVEAARLRGC